MRLRGVKVVDHLRSILLLAYLNLTMVQKLSGFGVVLVAVVSISQCMYDLSKCITSSPDSAFCSVYAWDVLIRDPFSFLLFLGLCASHAPDIDLMS